MLLNLYGVIYIACIDVYYSQFFVVLFQHAIHKTLQVAPLAHIFGFEATPIINDRSLIRFNGNRVPRLFPAPPRTGGSAEKSLGTRLFQWFNSEFRL